MSKGDVLAAERTDPDMVPGMRIATAIISDVGGDTSHAAITSRELGIPAVIGIQHIDAIRALDGCEVTVDGTRGRVYRGLLPLLDAGGALDVAKLPLTKCRVGLVLADVGQALFLSRLRDYPRFKVGLLRAEFMLGNISVHPQALEAYDNGELDAIVDAHMNELEERLSKLIAAQMEAGLVVFEFNLREYVGQITGLTAKLQKMAAEDKGLNAEEILLLHRRMREVDHKLDTYLENATRHLALLKTSMSLAKHIECVMGYDEELAKCSPSDSEGAKRISEIQAAIAQQVGKCKDLPVVKALFSDIAKLREEVSLRVGLKKEMDEMRNLPDTIAGIIKARGFRSGKEHYVQTLAQNLSLFAMAFYGKKIVYRTTDFKSNEYRNLVGGNLFEQREANPMLGYRGVSRNVHDWELEAFKLARGVYGASNLQLMLPFVRTLEEARAMRRYMANVHNMVSGEDGLKIIMMSEIPSNAIISKEFIEEFDGFSIGSNDMTQMVLATDRDNARLKHIYDEEDPAVIWTILASILTGQKWGKEVGFCGQGVSNSVILRGVVAIAGIASASCVPDTYAQTVHDIYAVEQEGITLGELGEWLTMQHYNRLAKLLTVNGYGHILKRYTNAGDLQEWYDGEESRRFQQLREHLGGPKADFYRTELNNFRAVFHKAVVYATWDWNRTVLDALHHAGFESFEEQAKALEAYRKLDF